MGNDGSSQASPDLSVRCSVASEELRRVEDGNGAIQDRERGTRSTSVSGLNAVGLPTSQIIISHASPGLPGRDRFSHNPRPHDLARAVQILEDRNQVQYVYSPDTVASELLTADLASTRWLDLLAFDAAQADKSFSLAPTRHGSPAEGISDLQDVYRGDFQAVRPPLLSSERAVSGGIPPAQQSVDAAAESHAWQLEEEIPLQNDELALFRTFTERAALWMDLFDPLRHFATHATRLAVSLLAMSIETRTCQEDGPLVNYPLTVPAAEYWAYESHPCIDVAACRCQCTYRSNRRQHTYSILL